MADIPYFPHDFNARGTKKLKRLRRKHGPGGYGRYWMLLEMMRESPLYRIDLLDENTLEDVIEDLDFATEEDLRGFLKELVDLRLIEVDGNIISSAGFDERMAWMDAFRQGNSERAKKAAKARWGRAGGENANDARALLKHDEHMLSNATHPPTHPRTHVRTDGALVPSAPGPDRETTVSYSPALDYKYGVWSERDGVRYFRHERWASMSEQERQRYVADGHVDPRYIKEDGTTRSWLPPDLEGRSSDEPSDGLKSVISARLGNKIINTYPTPKISESSPHSHIEIEEEVEEGDPF